MPMFTLFNMSIFTMAGKLNVHLKDLGLPSFRLDGTSADELCVLNICCLDSHFPLISCTVH